MKVFFLELDVVLKILQLGGCHNSHLINYILLYSVRYIKVHSSVTYKYKDKDVNGTDIKYQNQGIR